MEPRTVIIKAEELADPCGACFMAQMPCTDFLSLCPHQQGRHFRCISHTRKQRLEQVKTVAQDHIVDERQDWGCLTPSPRPN